MSQLICFICKKPIIPPDKPMVVKLFVFHEKCFSEVSDTYKKSKVMQKLVKFAFKGRFPGVN
jgi:hypothetical protein